MLIFVDRRVVDVLDPQFTGAVEHLRPYIISVDPARFLRPNLKFVTVEPVHAMPRSDPVEPLLIDRETVDLPV